MKIPVTYVLCMFCGCVEEISIDPEHIEEELNFYKNRRFCSVCDPLMQDLREQRLKRIEREMRLKSEEVNLLCS